MHAHISRHFSVLIFSFIVINSMSAGHFSKELHYRCSQLFQIEAVFIKNSAFIKTNFSIYGKVMVLI